MHTIVPTKLFLISQIPETLHPCNSFVLGLPSQSVFCGATFMMRDPSQTVHDYRSSQSHTFTFPRLYAIRCKSAHNCRYKLYAKLEYIPHDSSVVPASDDRPIARVLL